MYEKTGAYYGGVVRMSDRALLDELLEYIESHEVYSKMKISGKAKEIRTRMATSPSEPYFIPDRFNSNLSVFFDWNENGSQFMLWVKNTLTNTVVWRLGDIRVNDVRRNHGCNDYSISKLGMGLESQKINHDCHSCKHQLTEITEIPCILCNSRIMLKDKWQPKEEKKDGT